MSETKKRRIHLIYGIILSFLAVVAGACLIWACISIYRSGEASPFTRERVSEMFVRIAWSLWLFAFGVLGSVLLSVFLPLEEKKIKARVEEQTVLQRLRPRLLAVDGSERQVIDREEKKQFRMKLTCAIASVVIFLVPVLYCLIPVHFGADTLNRDVLRAVLVAFCAFFAVAVLIFVMQVFVRRSVRRELLLAKALLAEKREENTEKKREVLTSQASPSRSAEKPKNRLMLVLRCSILAVAVVLILLGIANGGIHDVFDKATNICQECIGLG